MKDYTIQNQEIYNQCSQRLQYLKNVQPQTEGTKMEIKMIEAEMENFEKIKNGVSTH